MKIKRLPIAILAATFSATPVLAAQLEEVIVTAQKREQSMQDVPFSVSAISGKTLRDSGVVDIMDLQTITPSLMTPSTGSPGQGASFRLRGFGSPPFNLGIEPAVATFVDGVYRSRSGVAVSDLVDIARVEVLKGPQGTLFGKNTTAGVVHVITNRPNLEQTEGFVEGSYGEYDRVRAKAMTNLPVTDNSAVRVSGSWGDGDGYFDNNFGPDDSNDLDRWNVQGQWLYVPSDDLEINLSASYSDISEICCAPIPVAELDDTDVYINTEEKNDATDAVYSMHLNWSISDAIQLTSITAYQDYELDTIVDGDFVPLDILAIVEQVEIKGFTQELRFSGSTDSLEWTLGGFYSDDEIDRDRRFVWGEDVGVLPFGLSPGLGTVDILSQDGDSWAIFGQGTYAITERLAVTAGLRYNDESKDGDGKFELVQPGPPGPVNPSFKDSVNEDEPTGMASIQYDWNDNIMTYATYQHGYKAGGINLARESAGLPGQPGNATFDKETADNYEIGAKMDLWDDRVRLNVALFHTEYDDQQNQILVPPGVFIVRNGEGSEIDGLELEGAFAATETLSFNFGLTLLDSSFDDGTDFGQGDVGGNDLPWAPETSGSIGWDYVLPFGSNGLEFFWTGNALYRDSYIANSSGVDNDPELEQDSSEIYNTQMGLRNDQWSAMVWCRNCSDEVVKEVAFPAPLPITGTQSYINRPQEFGVTVRYTY